ncbi:hypothetical protein PM082_023958 [Marasmius tenuissimus]|nr:hypothetical protein PM082_023958 [Marasmius tenuissimus]
MTSLLHSYTVLRNNPNIFRTSSGNDLDITDREVVAPGGEFIGFLNEVGACANTYQQRHHFEPTAIYNFLGHIPTSRRPLTGYNDTSYHPPPAMRGLKGEHMAKRWTKVAADQVPLEIGNVEMYRPCGPVLEHSFSFGNAILGNGEDFDRAVMIGVIHHQVPDKMYILAQTDQRRRVIVFEVPTESVVPMWPAIHSPHLQVIANIAPDVAGLSVTGNHSVRQRLSTLYPSKNGPWSSFPRLNLSHLPGVDETWVEPSPTFPAMAKPYGLGDWLLSHSIAVEQRSPSPNSTYLDGTTVCPDSSVMEITSWPRPPSQPTLSSKRSLLSSASAPPFDHRTPLPPTPTYQPREYRAVPMIPNSTPTVWPKEAPEEHPLVSEDYRLQAGTVGLQAAVFEINDEDTQQMKNRNIGPEAISYRRTSADSGNRLRVQNFHYQTPQPRSIARTMVLHFRRWWTNLRATLSTWRRRLDP